MRTRTFILRVVYKIIKNHETILYPHRFHLKLFPQLYYVASRYRGSRASMGTLTFTIIETQSADVCNNWKLELLLKRWWTIARSIVSTRIPIKVPASRSYTRTPFVKSVDVRTCAHIRHVYTRTRTHRRRQMAFVYLLARGKTCRKVGKRMIFRSRNNICKPNGRLRGLCERTL